jgi:hypothetical protein
MIAFCFSKDTLTAETLGIYSQDSAVSIATGNGLDNQKVGVQVPVGAKILTSPCCAGWLWGPPSQWVLRDLSPGIKRPEREADHSRPTSADVKKTWVSTSTRPYIFMV